MILFKKITDFFMPPSSPSAMIIALPNPLSIHIDMYIEQYSLYIMEIVGRMYIKGTNGPNNRNIRVYIIEAALSCHV